MLDPKTHIASIIQAAYDVSPDFDVTIPDVQFGDFATNVAFKLSKDLRMAPVKIAEELAEKLRESGSYSSVEVIAPGFINLIVHNKDLVDVAMRTELQTDVNNLLLEYSCLNPFKAIHTGHLYQTILGDSLGRIYEHAGVKVFRANFGGDVGLHVGKSMWGIISEIGGEHPEKLDSVPADERATWLTRAYVSGASVYEASEESKQQIEAYNKQIYELHNTNDHTSPFATIYWTCRQWSYDYFREFYELIDVKAFDQYYGESQTFETGLKVVNDNLGTVFEKSDDAIILSEEKSGLHTRVFITSKGLPTYETKDLGVIHLEAEQFDYDQRIIMTGNDQSEYMKVVFKALELVNPELGAKQTHISNGTVKFGDGRKMSSRLGNVASAMDVLAVTKELVSAENADLRDILALGAIKYSFLKSRIGGDIAFDIEQSVSLEGNSGPYLQYATVRAHNILEKAGEFEIVPIDSLDDSERALVRQMSLYSGALSRVLADNSPHHLCTYLYELSQIFNRFYETSRVIGDDRQAIRLQLVSRYHAILKEGLGLMGIDVPASM